MNVIVESLHRLYRDKKIDKDKIDELMKSEKLHSKITPSDYEYIISDENTPLAEK